MRNIQNSPAASSQAAVGGLVSLGAALGAVCRFYVSAVVTSEPWSILFINVLGCIFFGAINASTSGHPRLASFLGPGFAGGFTTFSAFVLCSVLLGKSDWLLAVGVVTTHVIMCPLAFVLGRDGARRVGASTSKDESNDVRKEGFS